VTDEIVPDALRDALLVELAELAWGVLVAAGMRDGTRAPSSSVIAHAIVGNLLPVVDRIANQRAASELRATADAYDEGDGASLACAFFRARADELDLR
jgi:hypothetical protein